MADQDEQVPEERKYAIINVDDMDDLSDDQEKF